MSQLEQGMALIIGVFDKYSCAEGNKYTLTKGEMKTLLEKELPNFLESAKDKNALDRLMKDLDENGDCEIDFNEFIIFVAAMSSICHKFFENQPPK